MKRKLNAPCTLTPLATLFVACTAQAQSGLTISGLIDIGIYRDASRVWNVGSIQRSNLAFSGIEDLGGGLSASFRISTRFEPDTGTTELSGKPVWHDETTVGLQGNFGAILAGRRYDAIYRYTYQFDPWLNLDRLASPAWDLWAYNYPSDPRANSGAPEYGRLSNGLFYDSPTVHGLALHLSGSPETSPGAPHKARAGSLTFTGKSIVAMAGHGRNGAASTDTVFGVKLMFADVDVMAVVDRSEAGSAKARTCTAGLSYRLRTATLRAGWGQVRAGGVRAEKMLSAGILYPLSRRTGVYADLARKEFIGRSATLYGVGLAHGF